MKTAALFLSLFLSENLFANPFVAGEKIICTETQDQRVLSIEILDPARQTASMSYSMNGHTLFDGEGAYAVSGAGIDFALVSAGRPTITMLVTTDLQFAYVPRNGIRLSCSIEN